MKKVLNVGGNFEVVLLGFNGTPEPAACALFQLPAA